MRVRANGISNLAARFRALALLPAAGLVLLCPCASWARSQSTAKPAASAKATPVSKAAPQSKQVAAMKAPAKGLNTGITVHGWWKIDVRNPDGKLVTHREFENQLITGGSGDALLARVLGREVIAGQQAQIEDWLILLNDSATNQRLGLLGESAADCTQYNSSFQCISSSLSVQVVGSNSTSVALTDNFTVPSGAPPGIDNVQTINLDGNLAFTEASIPSVPITVGQLVTVSVTFSFQ